MSKHNRWLLTEIERWAAERIVTPEQAALLRARYAEPVGGLSWGLAVFFGLGTVIAGLGVSLLFAYNWDAIPKFGKLALIFGATAAAHLAGLRRGAQSGWRGRLGEALSLLGTMLFGAGIWLVAQIYHIDEHFPNGFLIWAVGALAMAWALTSIPQAILAAVLLAIWGGTEALNYHAPADISSLVILVGLAPLAWRTRSAVLLATIVAALYWLLLVHAAHWGGATAVFGNAFALSTLLIAAARVGDGVDLDERMRGVLAFFGWCGFLLCAYILSFDDAAGSVLHRWTMLPSPAVEIVYRWLLFVCAAATWIWLLVRWRRDDVGVAREEWLCPIGLVYAQALTLFARSDAGLVAVVFNLICLAIAGAWMVRGCQEGRLRLTVIGSLLLAAVLLARFFDLFDSLALRGAAFVTLGALLFAEGFYYRKLRRAEAEPGGGA